MADACSSGRVACLRGLDIGASRRKGGGHEVCRYSRPPSGARSCAGRRRLCAPQLLWTLLDRHTETLCPEQPGTTMTVRVLLLSGTRPLRARRVAERISREQPDSQVCGVVQQSLRWLPWLQQLIAAGDIDRIGSGGSVFSNAGLWIRKLLGEMVHGFLWIVHGCPQRVHATLSFTAEDLATCCRQSGSPFVLADDFRSEDVIEFVRRQRPDLIVVLGEPALRPELLDVPSSGLAQAVVHHSLGDATALRQQGSMVKLEHFAKGSKRACPLVSLTVPSHPHEGLVGDVLKNDLIADDLLVQATKRLGKASQTQASREITEWVRITLSPYFEQFGLTPQA